MMRRVVGKSMEPTLYEGDIVISRKKPIHKGDIVLANINGREVVKRIYRIHGRTIELRGDNTAAEAHSRVVGHISPQDVRGVVTKRITKRSATVLSRTGAGLGLMACSIAVACITYAMLSQQPTVTKQPASVDRSHTTNLYEPGSVKKDVSYCEGQSADIYYPRSDATQPAAVVLYLHGGGWFADDKDGQPAQIVLLDSLRDHGVATMAINYRKAPQYVFPSQIDDARCAVRFVRSEAKKYGFDPQKVSAFGFSAGGHLAAMLGVVDDKDGFVNSPYPGVSSKVSSVVSLAGLFDFRHGLRTNNTINIERFMDGQPLALGEPISYVDSSDAPTLLLHGTLDNLVLAQQNELYAAVLKQAGVPVEEVSVRGAIHGLESGDGQPTSPTREDVAAKIEQFILSNF